jgi:hypothetical protein
MTHQSCVSDLNEIQMSFLNGKNMINQKVVLWICGFICAQFRALFAAQGLSTSAAMLPTFAYNEALSPGNITVGPKGFINRRLLNVMTYDRPRIC